MAEYVEYFALKNLKEGKYPLIFSGDEKEYKYFKRGKNDILLWDPYKEPFVLNESKKKESLFFEIKKGKYLSQRNFIQLLIKSNYEEYDKVYSEREFARRGFIIDVYFEGEDYPLRLEFFGDYIDEIRIFDPVSQRKIEEKESLYLYIPEELGDFFKEELLKPEDFYFIEEKSFINKRTERLKKFSKFSDFIDFLKREKKEIYYVSKETFRFSYLKKLIPEIKFLKGEKGKSSFPHFFSPK